MIILDELALKYKTDKGSYHHNYTKFYSMFFDQIRDQSLKILEIGINKGSSLKMWKEYFFNSNIYGIDIKPVCKDFEEERIKIYIGSQIDKKFLFKIKKEIDGDFDIIIDDGSHQSQHQIFTFETIFPFVRTGGYYIIEDLQVSYLNEFNKNSNISGISYFKNLIDSVNLNGKSRICCKRKSIKNLKKNNVNLNYFEEHIEYMFFCCGLCIIKKI